MVQFRQSGSERFSCRSCCDSQLVGLNPITHRQGFRIRRIGGRSDKSNFKISLHAILLMMPLVALITIFGYHKTPRYEDLNKFHGQDDDWKNEFSFLSNVTGINRFEVLNTRIKRFDFVNFGHSSVMRGQDSRYWNRDDGRRGEEYNADRLELPNVNDHVNKIKENSWFSYSNIQEKSDDRFNYKSMGQYDETATDEHLIYEAEYNDSLKNAKQSIRENSGKQEQSDCMVLESGNAEVNSGEYSHGSLIEEYRDLHKDRDKLAISQPHDEGIGEAFQKLRIETSNAVSDKVFFKKPRRISSRRAVRVRRKPKSIHSIKGRSVKRTIPVKRQVLMRRPPIVHKSSGPSCDMKFLNSTAQLVEPSESPRFSRFSLQYTEVEKKPDGQEKWKPRFAGHQTLKEREESFYARDKRINCGFVQGPKGYLSTGFDLAEDDARLMATCHIAVSSCIFGNSDYLRTPEVEMITRLSRKSVCFVMFTDENTLQTLSSEGQSPDVRGFIGLWKIVVVKNLPYSDMRRVGKIPKFLAHRLFPSARYSIWLDSKLLLQRDPLLILDYFLWHNDCEYAISNHYDRHCVWEEVVQNKKLNKYNHTSIDEQFLFYQADGLTRFNASDPSNPLPSNVPEGSFIVRAHTPMSNLFSCLWFNEVDRFTSRDQLSFAYVYHKLRRMNPGTHFHLNMFKDCERRAITRLFHHRAEEKQNISLQGMGQTIFKSLYR